MKTSLTLLLSILLFSGCKQVQKIEYVAIGSALEADAPHPGKKLMETNCYVCHSPTASHDNRLAPPMIAIKKHYIDSNTTKEQFTQEMLSWIENPSKENAKLFGAVKRFGVMPKTPYPTEVIEQIADYMYDYEIEQPEWFDEHFRSNKGKQH